MAPEGIPEEGQLALTQASMGDLASPGLLGMVGSALPFSREDGRWAPGLQKAE